MKIYCAIYTAMLNLVMHLGKAAFIQLNSKNGDFK